VKDLHDEGRRVLHLKASTVTRKDLCQISDDANAGGAYERQLLKVDEDFMVVAARHHPMQRAAEVFFRYEIDRTNEMHDGSNAVNLKGHLKVAGEGFRVLQGERAHGFF
jgi:hypothetical protein